MSENVTCRATANTNTKIITTTARVRKTRTLRGSQVSSAAIVPCCQSAPTDDPPITTPITNTRNDVPRRMSGSENSWSWFPGRGVGRGDDHADRGTRQRQHTEHADHPTGPDAQELRVDEVHHDAGSGSFP